MLYFVFFHPCNPVYCTASCLVQDTLIKEKLTLTLKKRLNKIKNKTILKWVV